jgi:hypothetical protein
MLLAQMEALGGMLCALVVGLLVGIVLGAAILRAACSLYNKLIGGRDMPGAVAEPPFGKAAGIVVVIGLVNLVVGLGLGLAIGIGGAAMGANPQALQVITQLLSLPIGFLVAAGMLAAMLPTTFGRAVVVTLLQYVIVLVIVVGVLVIIGVVFLLMGGFR